MGGIIALGASGSGLRAPGKSLKKAPLPGSRDQVDIAPDSFPGTPSGGRRILRVFSSVDPDGRARA